LLIIATPWGPRSATKKAIQTIKDYFHSSQQDREATSPFHKLSCISPLANDLRIAVKLANDVIYNEDNKNEYISGIELLVLARSQNEICWVQCGQPSILLDRPRHPLTPLGPFQDLATEFSLGPQLLSPLPNQLIGVDSVSDFCVQSFRPAQHDRLILISRSILTTDLMSLSPGDRRLDRIAKALAQDDPDLPFWIGHLNVSP